VATIPVRVDYNHELKPLEDLLSGVERPGDFFVSGKLEAPMPKVEVEGVGVLSFPVPAAQIKEIIPQSGHLMAVARTLSLTPVCATCGS
jgi:hypothetical protein